MRDLKIDEIKDLLSKEPNEETMNLIKEDTRAGVKKLLQTYYRRLSQEKLLKEKFLEMRDFDLETIDRQNIYFAGIDEVGRGPLAGPVVSAAVILKKDAYILGIDDSKKLTDEKREKLFNEIITSSESIGIGIIDAKTIDKVNIYEATKLAMVQAVNNLSVKPDHLLIDAMKLDVDITCSSIIKGDTKSLSIAAASIVAKVTRDRLMKEYSLKYPEYLFNKNMGYGTKEHLQAIQSFGVLPIHRRTFAPIKDIV